MYVQTVPVYEAMEEIAMKQGHDCHYASTPLRLGLQHFELQWPKEPTAETVALPSPPPSLPAKPSAFF
jgi:hypothetical protein